MKQPLLPRQLIGSLGGRFSRDLGIDLDGADSAGIFRWLLASKLMGARISTQNALKTYKEFERREVVSPEKIRQTGWEGLVEILDAGGYTRYDFSTATNLLAITDDLMRRYAGDLNVLHGKARDPKDLEDLVQGLGKGIGEVTANIFLRELRTVWSKSRPCLSPLVLLSVGNLGLIPRTQAPLESLERFWSRRKTPGYDFRDFEAALLRLGKEYCRRSRCGACPASGFCRKKPCAA
jgi:endonuclease III